jgi:CRP-like cAMP-binding protein/CheY-like chemotaxis protein
MANEEKTIVSDGNTLRELLTRLPLFSGFPDDLLDDLKNVSTIVQVDPEVAILKQGEINKNLYFLMIGTVDVYVDDGLVATMRRKGDLLGEMSVISGKPCAATIVAKTPVELICVNVDDFKKQPGEYRDQFDHILYRIYSKILTEKVSVTNQKAKRVEETLDALQRAKNELQEINAQMERRVVERTQELQGKLQILLNDHLNALNSSLKKAAMQAGSDLRPMIEQSLQEVDLVVKFLEPLVQRFNLEVSMKSKRVLLAQGVRKAQTVAKMALGGTGIFIDVANDFDEAVGRIEFSEYDVVVIDQETLGLLDEIDKMGRKMKVVYLASGSIQESMPQLLQLKNVPNIVLLKEDDRVGSIRNIMTTVTKLCSPTMYGLEKYLNVGVDVKEIKIKSSVDRQANNDAMRAHFSKLGIRSSILDSVGTVLEELMMNAIYDAPTDKSGLPIYNKLPRTTPVDLKPEEWGVMRFATDGTMLAISVEDPFGALTVKTLLKYLDSCYSGREGTLQEEKGGAGRGLHQIVESSSFVVFNVTPKHKTEVIALFDVVPGPKEKTNPMIHYFIQR